MVNKQGRLSRQASVRHRGGDLIERRFDNKEIMEILEVSLPYLLSFLVPYILQGIAIANLYTLGKEEIVLWNNLPLHGIVQTYFEEEYPGWFE